MNQKKAPSACSLPQVNRLALLIVLLPGGPQHANAASPAVCHRPARVGHPYRPYRHPARLRRAAAPTAQPQHAPDAPGLPRRHRHHRTGAKQQRHGPAGQRLRRRGADGPGPGAGGHARRGCRHGRDGAGADPRSVLAVAAAAAVRREPVPCAEAESRRPARPGSDRPWPDHARPRADRRGQRAHHPCPGPGTAVRRADRRPPARRRDRRPVRHAHLFQPGHGAAHRHPGRCRADRSAAGHRPGDRRQHRQRRARLPQQQPAGRRRTAGLPRQPALQAARPAGAAAARPAGSLDAAACAACCCCPASP